MRVEAQEERKRYRICLITHHFQKMPVSFDLIKIGKEYSRKLLAEIWGYAAYQALARGVVTPKGDSKIILFVTAQKQDTSQQYVDKLVEEYLHWEGPNDHFAEDRMVQARLNGQTIHLFYRVIHHTDFMYFGEVEIVNVELETKCPSKFIFHLNEYYSDVSHKNASEYWTRNQLLSTFNLYLKLSSEEFSPYNQEVRNLADLLGKSSSSVAMILNNFAYVDPHNKQHGIIGLEEGAKVVQPIWNEFESDRENLVYESEQIVAGHQNNKVEEFYSDIVYQTTDLKGEDKIRSIKTRVNQGVFRKMVLKTYKNQCAISGMDIPEILIAGHIIPWAENEHERLNPENGICLSHLYDRAYEKGLICIDTDYKILLSKRLKNESSKEYYKQFFGQFENQLIRLPKTYLPKREFLQYRLDLFEI